MKNPFFLNSWLIHYSIRQFIKLLMIISTNLHPNQWIDQFMIRFLLIIKQLIGSKQSNDTKGLLKWKTIVHRATIQINPLCRWTITRKVLQSNGESSHPVDWSLFSQFIALLESDLNTGKSLTIKPPLESTKCLLPWMWYLLQRLVNSLTRLVLRSLIWA